MPALRKFEKLAHVLIAKTGHAFFKDWFERFINMMNSAIFTEAKPLSRAHKGGSAAIFRQNGLNEIQRSAHAVMTILR